MTYWWLTVHSGVLGPDDFSILQDLLVGRELDIDGEGYPGSRQGGGIVANIKL